MTLSAVTECVKCGKWRMPASVDLDLSSSDLDWNGLATIGQAIQHMLAMVNTVFVARFTCPHCGEEYVQEIAAPAAGDKHGDHPGDQTT